MKRFERILTAFLILAVTFSLESSAVPYHYFTRFNSDSGLPNNTIISCLSDSMGFIWVGTKDGLYRFDGHGFMVPDEMKDCGITDGMIGALCEDTDGTVWFTSNKGLGCYMPETGEVRSIEAFNGVMSYQMDADAMGNIWVLRSDIWTKGTTDRAVYRYNKDSGEVAVFGMDACGFLPNEICLDSGRKAWFCGENSPSLYTFDTNTNRFESMSFSIGGKENEIPVTHIGEASEGHVIVSTADRSVYLVNTLSGSATLLTRIEAKSADIRTLLERNRNEYWIGTSYGVFILQNGQVAHVNHMASDLHSLSGEDTWCMTKDAKGNVWIGTFYNGLNLWQNSSSLYNVIYENPSGNSIKGSLVRALCPDESGMLWIGTEDGGLNRLDLVSRAAVNFVLRNSNGDKVNIQGIAALQDEIWISTFEDGIFVISQSDAKMRRHYAEPMENATITILPDGEILAGSRSGLYRYDRQSDSFILDDSFGHGFIHSIMMDSSGGLWAGTYGQGIHYKAKGSSSPSWIRSSDAGNGLTSDFITSIHEDSKGRVWITTEGGGLCLADVKDVKGGTIEFNCLKKGTTMTGEGLTSNVTSAVAEDEQGNIWVSTSRGIVQIDPETMSIQEIFIKNNGIIGEQYSYGAGYTARNGDIYFGTNQGLFRFSPTRINAAMKDCPIYITEIRADKGEKHMMLHEEGKSTMASKSIRVRYKDITTLTLRYSDADISLPQSVVYSYSLTKSGKAHSETTTANHVSFIDIKPGHYTFRICRLGEENEQNAATIDITVTPPFYMSTIAMILYLLALAGMASAFVYLMYKRKDSRRSRQLEKLDDQKQKEIYKAKLNFFTNITHEIRTPLTLIKMPLDKIIDKEDYTETSKKDLLTIQDNTNRLLNLTNQILDMRKMDQNETELRYVKKDITKLIKRTYAYFVPNAADQHVSLSNNIPDTPVVIPCAEDVVATVMSNLLSNAVKYGKDAVEVLFEELSDKIRIRVNSNGKRISLEDSEKIFEMFYQIDNGEDSIQRSSGTGLGLPYARSMAKLHNGELYLDTDYPDWNSFVFELPLTQESHIEVEKKSVSDDMPKEERDSNFHLILVVEDDPQMRSYICNELSDQYNTLAAANGEDAMKMIESHRVDLVISDLMMPVMDGCQLCNAIKSSTDYSHIPVILLTAAVGIETRMETLEVGADGYIEKPFSMSLLRANIANLFKNREIAYHQFVNSPLTHYNSVTVSNVDQRYMDKLHEVIINNISDHNLNVDTLAEMLSTSKSTLYRKVKGNTGLNINEYIRLCRLKLAAEMLSSQKYRVNEVADLVGFSSPSYFATSFQKQFNISPSNFVKQLRGEE